MSDERWLQLKKLVPEIDPDTARYLEAPPAQTPEEMAQIGRFRLPGEATRGPQAPAFGEAFKDNTEIKQEILKQLLNSK